MNGMHITLHQTSEAPETFNPEKPKSNIGRLWEYNFQQSCSYERRFKSVHGRGRKLGIPSLMAQINSFGKSCTPTFQLEPINYAWPQ